LKKGLKGFQGLVHWDMEQKSIGLVVGSDGVVYRSIAETPIEARGMFPRPMAGDSPFPGAQSEKHIYAKIRTNKAFS
jgi:hypothetical protein